ncbi:MAG TPA: hypothetical protein VFG87_25880 [Amycolatopsis sp.]|jgi:hypothetical protein|nr:hypothetical protein [Amycolatopsis sp.]
MSDPVTVDIGDSWKPASLREAEVQLDETMAKSRELIKQVEEKLKQLPDVDHTAKPEDITAIKTAAEKPDAPAALRELKKKVDAGELTWKDVVEGKAFKDDAVREAMSTKLGQMREVYQEVQEGATLDEILEARGVTSGSVFGGGSSSTYAQSAPAAAPPSEDDYFSGSHVMTGGSAQSQTPPAPPPAPTPPAPPSATPPAPERGRPTPGQQQPRRTPPSTRQNEEYTDEDTFANPLTSRGKTQQSEPTRPATKRRRDEPDDEEDYFGGSVMR